MKSAAWTCILPQLQVQWHQIVVIPLKTEWCLRFLFLAHLTYWDFRNSYTKGGKIILGFIYVRYLTGSLELCILWNQIIKTGLCHIKKLYNVQKKVYNVLEESDRSGNSRSEFLLKGRDQCNPSNEWPCPLDIAHAFYFPIICTDPYMFLNLSHSNK